MGIVTLTMNPALDKSTNTHHVTPEDKLRCEALRVEPGGGGINVSRAVKKLGGASQLFYVAGGLNGQALTALLHQEDLDAIQIEIVTDPRESFTVLEETTTHQYRFTMPGPTLTEEECASGLGSRGAACFTSDLSCRQRESAAGCARRLLCTTGEPYRRLAHARCRRHVWPRLRAR